MAPRTTVQIKMNGESYGTAQAGELLGEVAGRFAKQANLRSFAVLLDDVKQNNTATARNTALRGGQVVEIIAKDTRGN